MGTILLTFPYWRLLVVLFISTYYGNLGENKQQLRNSKNILKYFN